MVFLCCILLFYIVYRGKPAYGAGVNLLEDKTEVGGNTFIVA